VSEPFDALIGWLDERLGQRVGVQLSGPSDGHTNVGLNAVGALRREGREVSLIDPAPGRVEAYAVGDASLVLLEGDLTEVEFHEAQTLHLADGDPVTIREWVSADFGEVTVLLRSES
jgi:hypothetical protein